MKRMDVLRPLNLRQRIFRPREVKCDLRVQRLLSPPGHARESMKRLGWLTAADEGRGLATSAASESLGHPLQSTGADGHDVEGDLEPCRLRMACEPGVGRESKATLLLVVHHLQRVAEPLAQLLLHLAEDQPPAAANDDVKLVTGHPGVRRQDPVPAHAIPPHGVLLGTLAGTQGHDARLRRAGIRVCHGSRTQARFVSSVWISRVRAATCSVSSLSSLVRSVFAPSSAWRLSVSFFSSATRRSPCCSSFSRCSSSCSPSALSRAACR